MAWIHGGGFAGGSASVAIYDGAALARHGIVVVTINYRVGILGILAHPALTSEGRTSGTYGLMDQVAALRWTQRNIEKFGGDPDRVTIAGQSAGAASVHLLLGAPSAAGLFQRAIAESDSGLGAALDPLATAEAQGQRVMVAAGVSDIAALRALPAEALTRAAHDPSLGPAGLRFKPVYDAHFLPDPQVERSDVPVLTGLNADEANTSPDWLVEAERGLSELLVRRIGNDAARFARHFQMAVRGLLHAPCCVSKRSPLC